jgi:hypothetical protein
MMHFQIIYVPAGHPVTARPRQSSGDLDRSFQFGRTSMRLPPRALHARTERRHWLISRIARHVDDGFHAYGARRLKGGGHHRTSVSAGIARQFDKFPTVRFMALASALSFLPFGYPTDCLLSLPESRASRHHPCSRMLPSVIGGPGLCLEGIPILNEACSEESVDEPNDNDGDQNEYPIVNLNASD